MGRTGEASRNEWIRAPSSQHIILPISLLFPWLAYAGIATSPFVYDTDENGLIEFGIAQEHAPVNMLPTGEILTERCREVTEGLMALADPYGPLSLVIRPAETGCWVDYVVLPWAPGSVGRFYEDVVRVRKVISPISCSKVVLSALYTILSRASSNCGSLLRLPREACRLT